MKRFHSSLQKVFDICTQQSRMAELELARAQSRQSAARQRVDESAGQLEQARQEINRALPDSRQLTVILGMRQHLAAAEDRLALLQQELEQVQQLYQQARQTYQEAHSKVERIEKLIEKQRVDYRREQLLDQQRAMDDLAIFRWTPPHGQLVPEASPERSEAQRLHASGATETFATPELQEIEVNRHG